MNRKLPIRTYKRKRTTVLNTTWNQPILPSVENCYNKSLHEVQNTKEGDDSLIDPFDTTFDRLVKNARVQIPHVDIYDNSWRNSTNSSYNVSNSETDNDKVFHAHVHVLNMDVKPFLNKERLHQESQMQVTRQIVPRKANVSSHNIKTSFKKQRNVSLKIKYKVKKRKVCPVHQLHKIRSQNGTDSVTDSEIESFMNSVSITSKSIENSDDDVLIQKKNPDINVSTYKKKETSFNTSRKKFDKRNSFIAKYNNVLLKWRTSVSHRKRYIKSSIKKKDKKDNVSMNKSRKSLSKIKKLKHNNSGIGSRIKIKPCYIKLERLTIERNLNVKLATHGIMMGNVVSSTPVGKPVKLYNYSIPLSPISINYSKEIKNDAARADSIAIEGNENNLIQSKSEKTERDSTKKCHILSNHASENDTSLFSVPSKMDLNLEPNADTNAYSKETSVQSLTTSIHIDGISKHDLVNTVQPVSTLGSIEPEVQKKTLRLLNYSIDSMRSRSLFSDSEENIETSVHKHIVNNDRYNNSTPNKSTMESLKLVSKSGLNMKNLLIKVIDCKKQKAVLRPVARNEELTLNIQGTGDQNGNNENMTVKTDKLENTDPKTHNTSKGSEYTTSIEENELNTSKRSKCNSSEGTDYNISKEINKSFNGSNSCHVMLARLQDTIRITKRRKQYHKWDPELNNINEDCNDISCTIMIQANTDIEKENLSKLSVDTISKKHTLEHNGTVLEEGKSIYLKPGKSWARSLSILNNITNVSNLDKLSIGKGKKWRHSVTHVLNMQKQGVIQSCVQGSKYEKESKRSSNHRSLVNNRCSTTDSLNLERFSRRVSIRVIPNNENVKCIDVPFLEAYGIVPEKNRRFTVKHPRESSTYKVQTNAVNGQTSKDRFATTAKDVVLQRCLQKDYMPFCEYFSDSYLEHCRKIGEGVYGEVFLYEHEKEKSVIKIIPIEGNLLVNGEPQKKFHEILSEIVIAKELHNLRFNKRHSTDGFVEVKNIKCLIGKYPKRLVELWNIYDEEKNSDNDCPSIFDDNQLFIVLELGHGGQDLEAFVFNTAEEAHALFIQAALTLAVSEKAVEFEHRDLHWGNILISRTDDLYMHYKLGDTDIAVLSNGVKVSIIDFTLSRISYQGCSIFNDLASDPALFTAQGEYQFEIYRLMRDRVENTWQTFEPYTNILWLHYTLDKMITAVRYKRKKLKVHKSALIRLQELKNEVLNYNNSFDFVTKCDKITSMIDMNRNIKAFTTVPQEQIIIANSLFAI